MLKHAAIKSATVVFDLMNLIIFRTAKSLIELLNGGQLLINAAGSDGRRNTCLQFTRRSFKAQRFPRALIQTQRDLIEMCLRVDG